MLKMVALALVSKSVFYLIQQVNNIIKSEEETIEKYDKMPEKTPLEIYQEVNHFLQSKKVFLKGVVICDKPI